MSVRSIEVESLSKQFKGRTAVESLSLSIGQGEMFALLGQNGAGKTTTIKMLSGLLTPSEGDARLQGNSIVHNSSAVKQIINVSPQETAVAPKLSVRENLELVARVYGSSKEAAVKKAAEMLETFGLLERAGDKAKTLSGGLQRRLSIAMALISNPEILFLDEPTLGLDVRARRDLWKSIGKLKGRITIILTTHYLEEAEALADRIGIMNQGKIQIIGTAEEIRRSAGTETLEDAFLKLTEEEGQE